MVLSTMWESERVTEESGVSYEIVQNSNSLQTWKAGSDLR